MIFEPIPRRVDADRVTQIIPLFEMSGYAAIFADGKSIEIPSRMPVPCKGDYFCEGRFWSPEEFEKAFQEVRFPHEVQLKVG